MLTLFLSTDFLLQSADIHRCSSYFESGNPSVAGWHHAHICPCYRPTQSLLQASYGGQSATHFKARRWCVELYSWSRGCIFIWSQSES